MAAGGTVPVCFSSACRSTMFVAVEHRSGGRHMTSMSLDPTDVADPGRVRVPLSDARRAGSSQAWSRVVPCSSRDGERSRGVCPRCDVRGEASFHGRVAARAHGKPGGRQCAPRSAGRARAGAPRSCPTGGALVLGRIARCTPGTRRARRAAWCRAMPTRAPVPTERAVVPYPDCCASRPVGSVEAGIHRFGLHEVRHGWVIDAASDGEPVLVGL
jgi:hypothetical protein